MMTRNLKTLVLALLAAFALTAVIAAGAQAQIKVTVGASPAWLTGEAIEHPNIVGKVYAFTLGGGQRLTCEVARIAATVKNGDTSVTVTPILEKCSVRIGSTEFPMTVTFNDCDLFFHGGKEVSSTTFSEGEVDLVCPSGKEVEIHVYKKAPHAIDTELCTYFISPFINKKANEFHNVNGSPNAVTITTSATEIVVTRTGGIICGGTKVVGTFTGSSAVIAREDLGGTISNGTVSGIVEGNTVSLTASK